MKNFKKTIPKAIAFALFLGSEIYCVAVFSKVSGYFREVRNWEAKYIQ